MSNTQSAHVCTSIYGPDGLFFAQTAECSRAALAVLHKRWLNTRKEGVYKDSLLMGWRALEERAKEDERVAIQYGQLLHLGVPAATRHKPNEDWRNHLIEAARKVPTC